MTWIRIGVDGSGTSGHALAWAAEAARQLEATLEVATVYGVHGDVFADEHGIPADADPEQVVRERQADVVAEHVGDAGDLDLRFTVLFGHPVERLCNAEPAPDLLVLGNRGVGGFVGMVLGSTAHEAVEYAPCTAVVVPHRDAVDDRPPRVAAGFDGSRASEAALGWAAEHAQRTGAELEVVVAWAAEDPSPPAVVGRVVTATSEEAASRLAERVRARAEAVASSYAVTMSSTVRQGRPHELLLERAEGARLLVLGAPGSDTPRYLGSVAHRCLRRATVPVAVVR